MQTFLPRPSFAASAAILDYRRLGKQRVEAAQILTALRCGTGWVNHPVTRMWAGAERALELYQREMILEWIRRGYRNSMDIPLDRAPGEYVQLPEWLGREDFHASHRSNLLRKDPVFYGRLGWTEPADLEYVWPV